MSSIRSRAVLLYIHLVHANLDFQAGSQNKTMEPYSICLFFVTAIIFAICIFSFVLWSSSEAHRTARVRLSRELSLSSLPWKGNSSVTSSDSARSRNLLRRGGSLEGPGESHIQGTGRGHA